MTKLHVFMGSKSDLDVVKASGMLHILEEVIGYNDYEVHVCSAHRNPEDLQAMVDVAMGLGGQVFIGVAGMAAALPGALAANCQMMRLVIGVPLDEHGIDSCLYMPPGVPVATAGVGKIGLKQAALLACQALALADESIDQALCTYLQKTQKKVERSIDPLGITEGKTKVIRDAGNGTVLIVSKDDITAGDGERRDVMEGKAALATTTTCNVFELLERHGVSTHYLGRVGERSFRARNVNMIPLELVVRRIATGSYLKRHPDVADGTVFDELVFELFDKDDANHDPFLEFDFKEGKIWRYRPDAPAGAASSLFNTQSLATSRYSELQQAQVEALEAIARKVFSILEEAWAQQGGVLFDFKIECGFDLETGELLVADVIDNDSWRLRFGDEQVDKQSYRDGTKPLPTIKEDYAFVATATESFVSA